MLNDLCRQGIQLNLFTAAFDQSVIDLRHPLREGEFLPLIKKVSGVEFTMELVDEIRPGETELVKQLT